MNIAAQIERAGLTVHKTQCEGYPVHVVRVGAAEVRATQIAGRVVVGCYSPTLCRVQQHTGAHGELALTDAFDWLRGYANRPVQLRQVGVS